MRRVHWFELEDLPWLPAVLRDGGTDLLHLLFKRLRFYDGAAAAVLGLIGQSGERRVVDLCSGGGGGTLDVLQRHGAGLGQVELLLTDLHPSAAARTRLTLEGKSAPPHLSARYCPDPVDALAPDSQGPGVRTMASALHHFRPREVTALIEARIRLGQSFAFIDVAASPALRRTPAPLIALILPLNAAVLWCATLLLTPWLRPVTLERLLLTYVVPLIPLLVAWDGSVSALRAYSAAELLGLAQAAAGSHGYALCASEDGHAVWLTGLPLAKHTEEHDGSTTGQVRI